jgi:MFS transporter, UMF1 family
MAITSGLLASILLPLFGAIVDHTQYRRAVGAYTAAGLAIIKGLEVAVGPETWFSVATLQVFTGLLFSVHCTASYAYTSELTTDSAKKAEYNTFYSVVVYVSTLIFMIEVLVLSYAFGAGDVGTARISQVISSSTSGLLFYFAWTNMFRDRPALSKVPDGMTLLECGFRKVFLTTTRIRKEYPALKWLILSIMFAESATSALVTIATTYMTQVLDMNSTDIGYVFLVVLLMGIPGSKLGGFVAVKLRNPVTSAKICDVLFIVATSLASLVLVGPDDKNVSQRNKRQPAQ